MNNDVTSDQRNAMEKYVNEYETTTTDKLNFQFMDIRKDQADLREDDEFSCTIGQKPGNFLRNRYRDILPYNTNRVEIDPTPENQDGYINASHIKYPETTTEYIASQAPLPETVVDFWHMICQYKVKVILMLCQLVESFSSKCERYWPKEENETKTFADFSVTFVKEVKYNDFSHRTLLVKSEKYGELEVEQLHYTEWPDHGCPQGEKHVLQLVEQMNTLLAPGSPILVHCSAGCGRTGTVIALNIIRELINLKKISEIDVKKLVLDLRRQRTSMVQTQTQYHLLHKCVAVYCKMALGIDTETRSLEGSPESVNSLPQAQPVTSSIDGLKKPLKSPKSTNPFLSSLSTEKPTLTINTSNGTNATTEITSTNPFYEDVAKDNAPSKCGKHRAKKEKKMLASHYPQTSDIHLGSNSSSNNEETSLRNRPMNSTVHKNPASTNVMISASSSRMFASYELSDDITRASVQCLERKYGGRLRAHAAATRIQRAFRRFRLEQQFKHLLQCPGAPGRRRQLQLVTPTNGMTNHNGDRQLYLKKLALSQPTLRYQPATSLRAQLRAEQRFITETFSNQSSQQSSSSNIEIESPVHTRCPPSPRPVEPTPPQQRPFLELMSPRLAQRRIVTVPPTMMKTPPNQPYSNHISNSSYGFTSPHKKISSPSKTTTIYDQTSGIVVAAGVSPSVWVSRQASEPDCPAPHDFSDSKQNVEILQPNGHSIAYYTNSLPRLDRRNHSVGPHKTNITSSEIQGLNHLTTSQSSRPMWTDQQRRRWYRIALNFFNKKPDRGLHLLINWSFVDDSPQAIAKLFLGRRGLSKQMIGEFLGTLHSTFHSAVLDCFISEIDMYQMEIDVALRHMLTFFRLPGEAQKIDHIMQAFGKRYLACNPDKLPGNISPDTIYVIAFAIIMLNTDLHTPSLKDSRRMKVEDFVTNLRGVDGGESLSEEMLIGLYERIKQREFKPGNDHITQVMKVDQSIIGKEKPKLVEPHRRLICYCRLHQILDVNRKQGSSAHQREIFLFNDLMLVAKMFSKKKPVAQYTLRYWTSLVGLKVTTFQTQLYNFGLHIQCPDGEQLIFNAKNNDDRCRFFADVRESVLESTEMESIRIELELDKQSPLTHNSYVGSRLNRENSQRDSGLPELDHNSPVTTIGALPFVIERLTTDSPSSSKPLQNGVSLSSGCSASNGSTVSTNSTPAPANRRLSFNSMDSGMIEEPVDLSV